MKGSEISTANSTQVLEKVVLPESVKEELHQTLITLKSLLKENPVFFVKLVNKCLEVGTIEHVYFNDVEKLLHKEYPDLMKYTDGQKLLKTSCRFVEEICLDSRAAKKLLEELNPQTEEDYNIIRDQIIHVIHDICNTQEDNYVGLIGGDSNLNYV